MSATEVLRAPFPAEQVGKVPRVTCSDCSRRDRQCTQHQRARCQSCGSYISTAHIHLDYVGHADVTSRLLDADPSWTWTPLAADERGLPIFDTDDHGNPVGLWIALTVAGVTRLGYGSCPSSQSDAVKVLIGDALRNAAMRFGVAVDLWAKGDRADPTAENATASAGVTSRTRQRTDTESPAQLRKQIATAGKALDLDLDTITADFAERHEGVHIGAASPEQLRAYRDHLTAQVQGVPA